MCDLLLEEDDAELPRCQSYVLDFLNELAQDNLIEVVGGATS
jgi:hypothetical protein